MGRRGFGTRKIVDADAGRRDGDSHIGQRNPVAGRAEVDDGQSPSDDHAAADPQPVGTAATWTTGRLYGEKTTFGRSPWWTARGWWKAADVPDAGDVRMHVGTVGDIAIAAGSIRGHRHRMEGIANQDAFSSTTVCDHDGAATHLIAVVCDGMGSAVHSAFGASVASQAATYLLSEFVTSGRPFEDLALLQERLLARVTESVVSARGMTHAAPPRDTELPDLQTTLTFAIVPVVGVGSRQCLVGSVGDSPIFLLAEGGLRLVAAGKDDGAAMYSTAAQGVLGATEMTLRTIDLTAGDALALTSDGVGGFVVHDGAMTSLGRDLAGQWRQPVGLIDFITDLSFEMASADDDRTAFLIWTRSEEAWTE